MYDISTSPLSRMLDKGRIDAADLHYLRRKLFPRGVFRHDDAATLIALERLCCAKPYDWTGYYLNSLTAFVLHNATPKRTISPEMAAFLERHLSQNGAIDSKVNFELLLCLLEQSRECPEDLRLLALNQIRRSVLGETALIRERRSAGTQRYIQRRETILVRRILFPLFPMRLKIGSRISPACAEFLVELNRLTDPAQNDKAWNRLAAKAAALYLANSSGEAMADDELAAAAPDLRQAVANAIDNRSKQKIPHHHASPAPRKFFVSQIVDAVRSAAAEVAISILVVFLIYKALLTTLYL